MPMAVYLLAITIFSMTTSEFMIAGMILELAEEFQVSISTVGYLITAYSAAMVIGGPILTAGLGHIPHKKALLAIIFLFFFGQVWGAVAWNYETMVGARIITGIASSAAFGIAVSYASAVVRDNMRGKAVSIVMAGLMISKVAGVPVTTLISQKFGWRASFWGVALLVLAAGLMMLWRLTSHAAMEPQGLKQEFMRFKNVHLWAAYGTSMLIIGSTFAGFSYFTPILMDVTGFSESAIPSLLALYGIATVVGNLLIGRFADRYTFRILFAGLSVLTGAFVIFGTWGYFKPAAVLSLVLVGLTGVSMNPAMVTRVLKSAGNSTMINTVHSSFITLGVVIGSSLGGLMISQGYGIDAPLWVGVILASLGLFSLIPYYKSLHDNQVVRSANRERVKV